MSLLHVTPVEPGQSDRPGDFDQRGTDPEPGYVHRRFPAQAPPADDRNEVGRASVGLPFFASSPRTDPTSLVVPGEAVDRRVDETADERPQQRKRRQPDGERKFQQKDQGTDREVGKSQPCGDSETLAGATVLVP